MPKAPTRHTLISNSAYIFAIRALPVLAATVVLLLFARRLPQDIYGNYQKFWAQWSVLNAIICLGLPSLLLTLPAEILLAVAHKISARHIIAGICWMLFAGMIFLFLQHSSGIMSWWAPPVFVILFGIVNVLEAALLLLRKLRGLAWINAGYALLFVLLHMVYLRQQITFRALFGWLTLLVFIRLLASAILYRNANQGITFSGAVPSLKTVRHLWLHLGIYDVSQNIFRWMDKFLLSFLLAPASFALYFNGTVDVPFLALLLGAVGSALLLQMSADANDDSGRVRMAREAGAQLARVVFPVFAFLAFFRAELFGILLPKYSAATDLFLISILVLPLRAYNFTAILQHKAQGKAINAGALLDIVIALALMYPLYRIWALNGVALAFVLSTYFQAAFYLKAIARVTGCRLQELLPWRAWILLAIFTTGGFWLFHAVLIFFFNERMQLLCGGVFTLLVIAALTAPIIFIKKKFPDGEKDQPEKY